jgi:hypothetical protein
LDRQVRGILEDRLDSAMVLPEGRLDGRLRVMSEDRLNMPWAGQVTGKMGGSGDRKDGRVR